MPDTKHPPIKPDEWMVGAQPNPADRRLIRVEPWGSARIESLMHREVDIAGVTDLITGEDIVLQRISCGLPGCMCAVGPVGSDMNPEDEYVPLRDGPA